MALRRWVGQAKVGAKRVLRPLVGLGQSGRGLAPSRFGIEVDAARGLLLEGVALHELASRWGTPLHVVCAAKLRDNARRFQHVPSGSSAGCEVFYSYKTNPVPGVLSLLHSLGVGAEVISHYELWLARQLGVPPERIVYNGPGKSDASIREAVAAGIQILNLNHPEEIPRVARIARELGVRARVGLRVSTSHGWSAQFGTPIAEGAALRAYEQALREPSLDVRGLHAHRGGMIRDRASLLGFVDEVLAFTDVLSTELGIELEILNFGGSLGSPTVAPLDPKDRKWNQALFRELPPPDVDAALSIDDYVASLVERVETHYRERGRPRPRLFVEPGRAMTSNAQLLLTRVLTTKDAGEATYAVLDAGINHAESVRSEYHQVFVVNRYGEAPLRVHTLVGPICTPGDTLYSAVRLPPLACGDTLAIMDAGAYMVPFSTAFSFPRPAVVLVDGGQVSPLRRAERFEDLVAYDQPALRRAGVGATNDGVTVAAAEAVEP